MVQRTAGDEKASDLQPEASVTATTIKTRAKRSGAHQTDPWATWTKKRKIGRLKVSRSIEADVVANLTSAWWFAAQVLGLNFNLFVTIRPKDIDGLTPPERIKFWEAIRNKIAQFARDHGFEQVLIWSRESDPGTGRNEHLHALTHVPRGLRAAFARNAAGWFDGLGEIDVRPATYRTRWTRRGKRRNAVGYITKNSPRAAWGRDREYRKGGPILGKRVGCSRNIDTLARTRYLANHDARRAIQRDLGIATIKTDVA